MHSPRSLEEALRARELRGAFLCHSRKAWALLPPLDRPRILDIGCGRGAATLALAGWSDGSLVGIDTDGEALAELGRRLTPAVLSARVELRQVSLLDSGLPEAHFDLLWEEGVLHLTDAAQSLPACRRLVKPEGWFMLHETCEWFAAHEAEIARAGFRRAAHHLLPPGSWWADYYAPLEARITALRAAHGAAFEGPELAQHEREIAMVKPDPTHFDCGFYLLQPT